MSLRTYCLALLLAAPAYAGKYNDALSVGDPAPAFANLPGTDGKTYSLADFKDKDAVVVVFTCNSCPIAVDYEDRIIALAKRYADRVAVVAVNVNTIPADRLDKMSERAKEKGFPFPYLYDESQKTAKLYGANYTPEFFVLDRERQVVYMGALDDKTKAEEATVNYVAQALDAVLKGAKPATGETLARGCRVRFERKRR
jgi:peroxiredoxin